MIEVVSGWFLNLDIMVYSPLRPRFSIYLKDSYHSPRNFSTRELLFSNESGPLFDFTWVLRSDVLNADQCA
jgi:hypothetical protein